jgi:hypothetical protein
MKMDKKLKYSVAAATIAFVVFVAYAAYTTWQGTVTWQIAVKQFMVKDTSGNVLSSPYTINLGVITAAPYTYEAVFIIQNDGNVPVTVDVVEVTEVGCSGTWNATSVTLDVAKSAALKLTLTITGEGSYSFNFQAR